MNWCPFAVIIEEERRKMSDEKLWCENIYFTLHMLGNEKKLLLKWDWMISDSRISAYIESAHYAVTRFSLDFFLRTCQWEMAMIYRSEVFHNIDLLYFHIKVYGWEITNSSLKKNFLEFKFQQKSLKFFLKFSSKWSASKSQIIKAFSITQKALKLQMSRKVIAKLAEHCQWH